MDEYTHTDPSFLFAQYPASHHISLSNEVDSVLELEEWCTKSEKDVMLLVELWQGEVRECACVCACVCVYVCVCV